MGIVNDTIQMINQVENNKVYEDRGFANRETYLRHLALKMNYPFTKILFLALELGEAKDFDGLLREIEFMKYDCFLEDYVIKKEV